MSHLYERRVWSCGIHGWFWLIEREMIKSLPLVFGPQLLKRSFQKFQFVTFHGHVFIVIFLLKLRWKLAIFCCTCLCYIVGKTLVPLRKQNLRILVWLVFASLFDVWKRKKSQCGEQELKVYNASNDFVKCLSLPFSFLSPSSVWLLKICKT